MSGSSPPLHAQATLAASMWWYSATVFQPLQAMRRLGLLPPPRMSGDWPLQRTGAGLGPHFSLKHPRPVMLQQPTKNDALIEEFDRMAEVYDLYVKPFSTPIFDEALSVIRPLIDDAARVLDAGCGAGRELERMARLVPRGEVVGIDLAAGMVNAAYRSARAHGLRNTAFFQSDVSEPPDVFDEQFDVVYNSLAHHHYPDPPAATRAIFRVLRPGGLYCVIDPGPAWFTATAGPISRWADPGWIGFHTPAQFRALFLQTGFQRFASAEVLPGFCVSIGQKG
jgi:ubiquinone/menaquinone biosynthesis C-methylase UbiE